MKKSRTLLLIVFVALALLLSACVPGPRVVGTPGVTLSDEMVYVSYQNFVYGINPESGSVNWHYPEEANNQVVFYAQPTVDEDFLYVGDLANNFHKLNAETGEAEWTFADGRGFYMGKAAVEDGIVYTPSNDGRLYALDSDGNLLWSFKTGHYIWAQPQINDEAVFVGSMDHFVYALSKDGQELWSVEMNGAIVGSPQLSDDGSRLFVGSIAGEMIALDTQRGQVVWAFDSDGDLESVWGKPLFTDGMLYFADSAGQLFALNAETGLPEWQTEFAGSVVGGINAIVDGFVLATSSGLVKAYNFDSSPKWEATLEGESFQEPAANQEMLVAGTINGENLLYGFNSTGVQLWSTTPEN
jgi:outer membrane protein assembly factor BamB